MRAWILLCVLGAAVAGAADWPGWRGPARNGISEETGWDPGALAPTPAVLWRANVGRGYSGFAVVGGRAFTMGNEKHEDRVSCLDASTGALVWQHTYASRSGSYPGPRGTPLVQDGFVYTLGYNGELFCLDATDGAVKWSRNIATDDGAKPPSWGHASSCVIEGNLLLVNGGVSGLALDRRSGERIWSGGKGVGGYATPVVFEQAGVGYAAIFGSKALNLVEVASGRLVWSYEWVTSYDVNAADPVYHEGRLYLSSGYRKGCALLRTDTESPQTVWQNKAMNNHFSSCVLLDGYLYGVDGNAGKGGIHCVDWSTGRQLWGEPLGFGSLIAADGMLIYLNEDGTLRIGKASPEGFAVISSAERLLPKTCWTAPTLSGGKIFCRNDRGDAVCVDVAAKQP